MRLYLSVLEQVFQSLWVFQVRTQLVYSDVYKRQRLRDVVVEHEIYGQITVDLILENRCDVQDFLDKISKSTARPLSILTNGKHYHTVEADREEIIDRIEQKLRLLGYLQETI